LKDIINLINLPKFKNYSHRSFRLIIQFLYICRFLKEYLEIEKNKTHPSKKNIIDNCFFKIFDLKWIFWKNIKNAEYSYVIRFELLTLLNAYLEEYPEALSGSFFIKIKKEIIIYKNIFDEICSCFNEFFKILKKYYKNSNIKLTYNYLFLGYINDENTIYKDKSFDIAE